MNGAKNLTYLLQLSLPQVADQRPILWCQRDPRATESIHPQSISNASATARLVWKFLPGNFVLSLIATATGPDRERCGKYYLGWRPRRKVRCPPLRLYRY